MFVATSDSPRDRLALREVPSLPLRKGEVRVKVSYAGVNPVDYKMKDGGGPLRLAYALVGPGGPFVPGVDFAGEVVEVGPDVADIAVGQRLVGGTDFSRGQRGSYASEVIVRPDQCAVLPGGVRDEDAACLPIPGATAYRAFVDAGKLTDGKGRVLVLGAAGGVGLVAIQLAKRMGLEVHGVCSTRSADLVTTRGASVIDYTRCDALAEAKTRGPFDVVFNTIGSDAYPTGRCLDLLTKRGRLVVIVVEPKDYPSLLHPKVVHVLGRPQRVNLDPLVAGLVDGSITPLVEAVVPLADAEAALDRSRAGKVVGKLLLRP